MRALYDHLSGNAGADARRLKPTGGPVVASGGAPGGSEMRRPASFRPGAVVPYPEGVDRACAAFLHGLWPVVSVHPEPAVVVAGRVRLEHRRDQVARAARRGSRRGRGRRERHGPAARIAAHGDGRHLDRPGLRDRRATARCAPTMPTPAQRSGPRICRTAPKAFRRCMRSAAANISSSARPPRWCGDSKALGGTEPWVKKDASTPPGGYVVFALPEKGTADQEDQQ